MPPWSSPSIAGLAKSVLAPRRMLTLRLSAVAEAIRKVVKLPTVWNVTATLAPGRASSSWSLMTCWMRGTMVARVQFAGSGVSTSASVMGT